MSRETAALFFRKVQEDAKLRNQVATLFCERRQDTPSALARKIVDLGAEAGLVFTCDALREVILEIANDRVGGRELSDDELNGVAGGVDFWSPLLQAFPTRGD